MATFMVDAAWSFLTLVLISFSLGLIFGELKVVNFAQGDFVMVGAYTMYTLHNLNFGFALAVTVIVGLVLGALLERGILCWVYSKGFTATMLATWGISIVLQQLVAAFFSVTQKGVDAPISGFVAVMGVELPLYRLVVAIIVILVLLTTMGLIFLTPFGLRLRAAIDNNEMASLMGISHQRIYLSTFALSTALSTLAGGLLAPTLALTPTMGLSFIAPAFFSVLLAQGAIVGPVLGAALVQIVSVALQRVLSLAVADGALFALLVLMVVIWPSGLFLSLKLGEIGKWFKNAQTD